MPRTHPWKHKVANPAQLGGIETSVLDNGPGRGVRIAWINTGGGLRVKVALDRGMDLVDAFHHQHSLVWLSHGGLTAPRPDAARDFEWLGTFPGGLLTTCGLRHVGGPEGEGAGHHGLHGRISNQPAMLESVVQPDPVAGRLDFSLTGVVRESAVFGPQLELRRTIAGTLGEPVLRVTDTVTNRGNTACGHMILYHCNFGYPLADEGADIVFNGTVRSRSVVPGDDALFASRHNFRKVPAPLASHRGTGEGVALIDPRPDRRGWCRAGIVNRRLGLSAFVHFRKDQLPILTNWQHWGPGEYVTGLEPCNAPPVGAAANRAAGTLPVLRPGQSVAYELEFRAGTA